MKSISPDKIGKCCKQPAIAVFDYAKGLLSRTRVFRANRTCTACGVHWFGNASRVWRFDRQQWDRLMNRKPYFKIQSDNRVRNKTGRN